MITIDISRLKSIVIDKHTFLLFSFVLISNFVLRYSVMTSDVIYLDSAIVYGMPEHYDDALSMMDFSRAHLACFSRLFKNPIPVRIFGLIIWSFSAVIILQTLKNIFIYRDLLFWGIAIAFVSPVCAEFISFTYFASQVGVFFVFLGIFFSCRAIFYNNSIPKSVLLVLAASLSFSLAGLYYPQYKLISAAVMFMPWLSLFLKQKKKQIIFIPIVIFTFVGCVQIIQLIVRGQLYHYQQFDGWMDPSLNNALSQLTNSMSFIFEPYLIKELQVNLLITPLFLSILFILLYFIINKRKNGSETIDHELTIFKGKSFQWLPFFVFATILILIPLCFITQLQQRYLALVFIFFLLSASICLDSICAHSRIIHFFFNGRIGVLFLLSILNLTLYSFNVYHTANYANTVAFHSGFKQAVKLEPIRWLPGSQILILTNKQTKSTIGYNHWSTGYLRYITNRKDINAIIGPNEFLTNYPFIKDRNNFYGDELWPTYRMKDGTFIKTRKHMVGLVESLPTYLYSYNSNTKKLTSVRYLLIWQNEEFKLYDTTNQKLEVKLALNKSDISCINDEKIKILNDALCSGTINYTINPRFGRIDYGIKTGKHMNPSSIERRSHGKKELNTTESFIIETWLKRNASPAPSKKNYADRPSPVPCRMGPILFYQMGPDNLRVVVKNHGKSQFEYVLNAIEIEHWYNLKLDVRNRKALLFINDLPVLEKNEVSITPNGVTVLGNGFHKRYLTCSVGSIQIFSDVTPSFSTCNFKENSISGE